MNNQITILKTMPNAAEFYQHYWNQRPFLVRGGISETVFDDLIAAEELAGLSMEETARSRMVKSSGDPQDWSCAFGPFEEQDFERAGDEDWCLLVQNVEQFHPGTANLLSHFNFTPRWLMDDIMVSFSAAGGSVGAHIDSYHVFLVQGQGTRRWKVSYDPIDQETYVKGIDFKILEHGFDGDTVEVSLGDVLYIPPRFGHEGTTVTDALTFSVGFLGPKMSELYGSYGAYLDEHEDLDTRYVGAGLDEKSIGFTLSSEAGKSIQSQLSSHLSIKAFDDWLLEFFTQSSHEDFGEYEEREEPISMDQFAQIIDDGMGLIKPTYIKLAINATTISVNQHSMPVTNEELKMLGAEKPVYGVTPTATLLELFNHHVLEFTEPKA